MFILTMIIIFPERSSGDTLCNLRGRLSLFDLLYYFSLTRDCIGFLEIILSVYHLVNRLTLEHQPTERLSLNFS